VIFGFLEMAIATFLAPSSPILLQLTMVIGDIPHVCVSNPIAKRSMTRKRKRMKEGEEEEEEEGE